MPEDFVKPGHARQCAWCWDDHAEFAYIKEGRYDGDALEALAQWCLDASAYIKQGIPQGQLALKEKPAKLK